MTRTLSVIGVQVFTRQRVPAPPSMSLCSMSSVRLPARAALTAAAQPAGPPPVTITS